MYTVELNHSNHSQTIEAESFDNAFKKCIGDYVYRYVDEEDADICDVIIKCGDETRYIFVRFG
jgi:hypothetical protein